MAISFYMIKNYRYMSSLPAKKSQKYLCGMAQKQNLTMGKGAVVSCLNSTISVGPKSSCENRKKTINLKE